jgi:hypothetical protein
MWNLILVYLETVLVSVQDRCIVYAKYTIGLEKTFWTHTMVLIGDEAQVGSHFVLFGYSLNLDAR